MNLSERLGHIICPDRYGLKAFCPYRFNTLPPNQHLRRQSWVDKPTQPILIRRSTGNVVLKYYPVCLIYDDEFLPDLLVMEIDFPVVVSFFERLTIYTNSFRRECECGLNRARCLTRCQDCHWDCRTVMPEYDN